MFGKKKEVYTMPPEKPSRGKPKVTMSSTQPDESNLSEPEQPYYEETRADDGAGFLPEEQDEMGDAAPTKEKRKKEKPPKKAKTNQADKVPFFKDKRKVGILLIAVSLLVILVLSPLLNYLTTTKISAAVVATQDIPQGTLITEEMMAAVNVPEASLLSVHLRDKNVAINQYAKTDIVKDELITSPKLSTTLPYANDYLYVLPAGKKAISISIPSLASSVSGKLQQGDIISIFVMLKNTEDSEKYSALLPPELTYVQVLTATNVDGYDVSGSIEDSQLENALPATLTLAANDIQAALLSGLETEGTLHAALVMRGDKTTADNYLAIQDDYFKQLEEAKKAEDDAELNGNEAETSEPEEPEEPKSVPQPAVKTPPPAIPVAPAPVSPPVEQSSSTPEPTQDEVQNGSDEE